MATARKNAGQAVKATRKATLRERVEQLTDAESKAHKLTGDKRDAAVREVTEGKRVLLSEIYAAPTEQVAEIADWVKSNGMIMFAEADTLTSKVDEYDKSINDLKSKRAEAAQRMRDRRAREVLFVHALLDVHKIYRKRQDLADEMGINKAQLSNLAECGKLAAKMQVTNLGQIYKLFEARKRQSKDLAAAVAEHDTVADVLASVDDARKAKQDAAKEVKAAKSKQGSESETAEREAASVVRQAAKLLAHITRNGSELDVSHLTEYSDGAELIRELKTAIGGYERKHATQGEHVLAAA